MFRSLNLKLSQSSTCLTLRGLKRKKTPTTCDNVRTLVSVTFVRDRMLPMHARVALWSTRPRASVESIEP